MRKVSESHESESSKEEGARLKTWEANTAILVEV